MNNKSHESQKDEHGSEGDLANNFKLERYKYILQEIHSLNANVHKYVTLFQTLATAIVGGGAFIFVSWRELQISAETARIGIQGLLGLLIILTLFMILYVVVSALSWIDYRQEEVDLLDEVVKPGFRKAPQIGNFWRWNEAYIILFIIIIVIAIYVYVEHQVIPLIL